MEVGLHEAGITAMPRASMTSAPAAGRSAPRARYGHPGRARPSLSGRLRPIPWSAPCPRGTGAPVDRAVSCRQSCPDPPVMYRQPDSSASTAGWLRSASLGRTMQRRLVAQDRDSVAMSRARSTFCSAMSRACPLARYALHVVDQMLEDGGREAFGWLVHDEHGGCIMSARPMASICCSTRQRPGHLACPLRESREQLEHTLELPGREPRSWGMRSSAMARFSRTERLGNTRRPCGTSATPRWATSSGRMPSKELPPSVTLPAAMTGGRNPQIARRRVVLPMPFRPSSPTEPASGTTRSTPRSTVAAA